MSATKIEVRQRRQQAINLRQAGHTFTEIAEILGYSSRASAFNAVDGELKRQTREDVDHLREVEGKRLDAIVKALWPKVTEGDLRAIGAVLRTCLRRAYLFGLDTPPQRPDDGQIAHIDGVSDTAPTPLLAVPFLPVAPVALRVAS